GGAAAGAAEQAIREGKLNGDTLAAAAVGGVTGAVGGTAAEKVLPLVAARSSRAWRKLAAKMKTSVDDLEAYIADTQRATGVAPSIAQVFHARDQGLLQGWAARHNTFGTKMSEAAAAAPAQDLSAGRLRKVRSDDIEK